VRPSLHVRATFAAAAFAGVAAGCSILAFDADELRGGTLASEGGVPEAAAEAPETGIDTGLPTDAPSDTDRYGTAVRADGPIVYLRLGDAPGTVAKAAIGPDGTYSVAGVLQGKAGALPSDPDTAVELTDGVGRITVPSPPATTFPNGAAFSVELWARPATSNPTLGFVVDHTEWTDRKGWNLLVGSDRTTFELYASETTKRAIGAEPLAVEVWHHVVATFDGTTLRLYVDGSRVQQGAGDIAVPERPSTLTIGHQGCSPCNTNSFRGLIDEVAVYAKALTDAQVTAHFAAR
jgi:hypothetical protein